MDQISYKDPNDILSILAEREVIENNYSFEVEVESKLLREAFLDLQPLMSKTSYSKILSITVSAGYLILRASTSVVMETRIPIVGEIPSNDLTVTCNYEDIVEVLLIKGNVKVLVTPVFVKFISKGLEANLTLSDGEVTLAPEVSVTGEPLNSVKIVSGLKALLSLGAVSAVFKSGNAILFYDDIMQIRYPTIWVQAQSSELRTSMDAISANVLHSFIGRNKDVSVSRVDGYIVINKTYSSLYIPEQTIEPLESVEEYTDNYEYIGKVNFLGLDKKTQALIKTVGKVDCKVYLFQEGVLVEANTPTVGASVSTRDILEDSDRVLLDSFTTRLDFFNNILPLLGEVVEVYKRGDWVCIQGQSVKVILSSK